jgi:four helix bundle protein
MLEVRNRPIKSFTELIVWQAAYNLSLAVYKSTKSFPATKRIGLSSQMRRASVSVASNVAEGFGRSTSQDREYFYKMASGSLYELKSQILIAQGLAFLDSTTSEELLELTDRTHKLLHGLLRKHRINRSSNFELQTSKGGVHGEDI